MVRRELSAKKQLAEIRDEVDGLILELNLTTERNIGLLENKVLSLNAIFEKADQKMILMNREVSKTDKAKEVYTQLALKRPFITQPALTVSPPEENPEPLIIEKPILTVLENQEEIVPAPVQKSVKQSVKELYEAGISPTLISSKLGITLAEVQLFISLMKA